MSTRFDDTREATQQLDMDMIIEKTRASRLNMEYYSTRGISIMVHDEHAEAILTEMRPRSCKLDIPNAPEGLEAVLHSKASEMNN